MLTDVDIDALTRAVAAFRSESADHARQIDALLQSEPWEDVARFCAYRCQMRSLNLPPRELPPDARSSAGR